MSSSKLAGVAIAAFAFAMSSTVSASLVFDESIDTQGQGFGTQSNILTLHLEGGAGDAGDVESGIVSWDGSQKVCTGNGSEICDSGKTDVFTFGFLNIDNADELNLIWNPAEVGSEAGLVTQVDEVTVTVYNPNGSTFFSASLGPEFVNHPTTDPGHGGAGFVYILDDTQAAALNALLAPLSASTVGNLIVGLSSSVSFADNGPDTWTIRNLCPEGQTCEPPPPCTENCGPQEVPEPQSLLLLALGLMGLAYTRRAKASRR